MVTRSWRALVQAQLLSAWAKPVLILLCAWPGTLLLLSAFGSVLGPDLGPNPAEALIRQSGDLSIRALCFVLAVTPLRLLSAMPAIGRFRRILGLNVFAYALLHLLCYAWLDMGFEWEDIYLDILKRPFIYVGFTAFVLLSALALTSNNPTIAWMGAKRWRFLHRLVYVIAPLAVLHFYWMRAGKQRFGDVILYGSILALLLLFRWVWKIKAKKVQTSSAQGSGAQASGAKVGKV